MHFLSCYSHWNKCPIYSKHLSNLVDICIDIETFVQYNQRHKGEYTMNKTDLVYMALETMPNFLLVEKDGTICFMNKVYADLLGMDLKDIIGKPVTEVIPGTRMMHILKTGDTEIGDVMTLYDHRKGRNVDLICNRRPLKTNGKIVGAMAVTTFENISDIEALHFELERVKRENESFRQAIEHIQGDPLTRIIGSSAAMQEIKQTIADFAKSNFTFLLTGETGVGKEVFARAIHELSSRSDKPYIRINCAAIPAELLESELFGYEEGAFTGAKKSGKAGRFEMADGGTLLLDEIGEMPVALQSKLLRVLQEKEVERLGGKGPKKIDVRVICSTNINIRQMVKDGRFREDLYYRINTVEIQIPPLRERLDDLPALCNHFISKTNIENNIHTLGLDDDVIELFERYPWPGNVRELEHTIERLAFQSPKENISLTHCGFLIKRMNNLLRSQDNHQENIPALQPSVLQPPVMAYPAKPSGTRLKDNRDQSEYESIMHALDETGGNRSEAAKLLGISRSMFYNKLKKYKIDVKR